MKKLIWLLAGGIFLSNLFAVINSFDKPYSASNNITSDFQSLNLPEIDVESLLQEDNENTGFGIPVRFGYSHELSLGLNNSGTWEETEDGGMLWRLGLHSPGAFAMKILCDAFWLPEGGEFYVYNQVGDMSLGAYTHEDNHETGTFGVPLVKSDHIILEYYQPEWTEGTPEINISSVVHDYKDIHNFSEEGPTRDCGDNVACSSADPYEDQVNSGIFLEMYNYICSAALVNNTSQDLTPYVLTAYHCVEGEGSVGSHNWFNFYFKHQGYTCSSSSGNYNYSESGSYIRAWDGMYSSDFALLEMDDTPPNSFDAFYAGWSRSSSSPTISVGIHHPGGQPKKINFDNDTAWGCSWYGSSTHWCLNWDDGGTAGGSSGSPVFNNSNRIVGQLTGGTGGDCGNGNDYYGKFSKSWTGGGSSSSRLKDWLDPGNTGDYNIDGTYDGVPTVWGCTDSDACNYDSDATADDGSCDYGITCWDGSSECSYSECPPESDPVSLSFGMLNSGSFEIIIDAPVPVAGFQFVISDSPEDITLSGASGGSAEENDFSVSTSSAGQVIGFSLTGTTIPEGQSVLTNISYSGGSNAPELCLSDGIVSDANGDGISVQFGDCVTLSGSANLSFGVVGPGTVEIVLNSTVDVAGFQFLITDSPDDLDVTGASGGSSGEYGFQVSTSTNGTVLGFSLDGSTIPAGEDVLTVVSLSGTGSPELCLSDGIISDANGTSVAVSYGECVTAVLTLPGDLNGDGEHNVLDVVLLVNIILGYDEENPAGDLNQDGDFNVLDVVLLVNIILG